MANIFESNAPQDGVRATESAHRKIELQSPADLTYLIANVTKAALEKLDQHLPPDAVPEGEDAMRKRVEQLVDDYIHSTFNAAKDNITINGMDTREIEEELAKAQEGEGIEPSGSHCAPDIDAESQTQYCWQWLTGPPELEPFDTKLAQKIQALSAQIEYQTLQLANLRRKAPRDTAEQFKTAFERQAVEYEKRLENERLARMKAAQEMNVGVGEVKRVEEMQGTWQRGNEDLKRLNEGISGTVGKLEKAQRAVEVVGEK